ncbi:hypothetical protein AQUCO_01400688v1 [Aquilegia coerulea]|uniref:Bifunctional inhibitor/plant lipid transfer protein/seed storage helical domain-containing protein n=1 Tax=Aquilegia coerulea TaxID=218851 RepID=A0A2G5DXN7_AQUCA|nr:hypothetical protein AQUCO_01400688v1 [Aquilegia coerulea]
MAMVAIAMVGFFISNNQVLGQPGCSGDFGLLVEPCWNFVSKQGPMVRPSQECCSSVRSVNVGCVCKYMTDKDERVLSMQKIVYVAGFCGRPLAHGSRCGSYRVP